MINPRVGDLVWFRPGAHETTLASDMPLAAIVTHVHHNALVNLTVFGAGGDTHKRASAALWNGEGDIPERISYAEWMPDRDKVEDAPKVEDLPRLKGESDVDYESRNSLNRKQMTHDWSRKNGVAAPGSDPVDPDWQKLPHNPPVAPAPSRKERDALGLSSLDEPDALQLGRDARGPDWKPTYQATPVQPSAPPVNDLPRLAGENDQHYKTRNEANRKKVTDEWNRTHTDARGLPPAPVDPDPYASSVE